MLELSDRAKRFEGSPIRKMSANLEKIGVDPELISFGGGAPSLGPPKEVIEYVCKKLKEEPQRSTAYCSTPGPTHTRELISANLKKEEHVDVSPDEITLTIGGTEGIYSSLLTLVNPNDEIITPDPFYLGYNEPIKLVGAKQARVPVYWRENFQIDEERLKNAVTKRTKAMIVISPDNPTGALQDEKHMRAIVDICVDKKIWLITDDVYKKTIFEGSFVNWRKYGGYENIISCCSYSKTASIPGVRIGYTYGPKRAVEKITELKQATSLTAPKLGSLFIDAFLENNAKIKNSYIKKIVVPTYKKRRDAMAKALRKHTSLEFSVPQGAFYFFPEINRDDEKFCDRLLKEKKVAAVPGKFFGKNGEKHIRLTFVSENEKRIDEGVKRIADLL